MNKKIIGILVGLLFFGASVIPSIAGTNNVVGKFDYNYLIREIIKNRIISDNGWLEQDKLLALDGYTNDLFGYSVDVYEDTIIIGAIFDDDNGEASGSAYVFTRSGSVWTQQAKLRASDGAAGDYFGFSVAIEGDTAIIGANMDDDNGPRSGSAYVFIRSGSVWSQQAKLLASDGEEDDRFGQPVSIDNDTVIIGAYRDENITGSAYVFNRNGTSWIETQKLTAYDGVVDDYFGVSISIDGDYAIIGAIEDNTSGIVSGSAYVFIRSGSVWTHQAKLIPSDGEAIDYFGNSVSMDEDTVIIGAPRDDDIGDDSGSAYVFIRSGSVWSQQAKLLASDGETGDLFGTSVSLYDNTVIIGSPWDDYNGDRTGSAYVFNRSGSVWTQEEKLLASDGEEEDWFGNRVSFYKNTAIIGAYYDDDNGDDSGSAYVFIKENNPPSTPIISGPTIGKIGIEYNFSFVTTDPDGDDVYYLIDWGDGTVEDWGGPYPSGQIVEINHEWSELGTYDIRAKARDIYDAESDWSDTYEIAIGHEPPDAPTIDGPNIGKPGTSYEYSLSSVDPDGHDIAEYIVDWGDGSSAETISGPFASGDEATANHSWTSQETYILKAKAKDVFDAESNWSEFEVTIPRTKTTIYPMLHWLIERFPLLEKLLSWFR